MVASGAMDAQKLIAENLARVFRSVFLVRRARARALARTARTLQLATRSDIGRLNARADLVLGRARRERDEAER
jgi:hypothetical protein